MEAVNTLADGDDGVRQVWPDEYFEGFYDFIPHNNNGTFPVNSALLEEERRLLAKVSALLDAACDETPNVMTADELIATGWPERIKPIARNALNFMVSRGRFSEDVEEEEPSVKGPWP